MRAVTGSSVWRYRLDDLEALEFGMPEIERPVLPGALVGEAEGFRPCPGFEIFPAPPDRV